MACLCRETNSGDGPDGGQRVNHPTNSRAGALWTSLSARCQPSVRSVVTTKVTLLNPRFHPVVIELPLPFPALHQSHRESMFCGDFATSLLSEKRTCNRTMLFSYRVSCDLIGDREKDKRVEGDCESAFRRS